MRPEEPANGCSWPELLHQVTLAYRPAGRFAMGFVRGKLRRDPVFQLLLREGLLPRRGVLVDLGCGRGALLSLAAARGGSRNGASASGLRLLGIERIPEYAEAARRGSPAEVLTGDIRSAPLPACDTVTLLDVLLYLDRAERERLLSRVAAALRPGGVLLLREADAAAGARFQLTRLAERCCARFRGTPGETHYYRSASDWVRSLESLGFAVTVQPCSQGTPFANVLFVARRPARAEFAE